MQVDLAGRLVNGVSAGRSSVAGVEQCGRVAGFSAGRAQSGLRHLVLHVHERLQRRCLRVRIGCCVHVGKAELRERLACHHRFGHSALHPARQLLVGHTGDACRVRGRPQLTRVLRE